MFFDWQQFHASNADAPAVVDPRRRMRICLAGFAVLLLMVFGRVVQLEMTQGAAFRAAALRPIERESVLPAARGRILARDGTLLAYDRTLQAVAVEYRWLEDPADDGWLTAQARARLPKADRKDAKRMAVARSEVLAERKELARRLAALCSLSSQQWDVWARRIQARVQRIAEIVNRGVVAEELQHHVVADDVPATVVAEIENHPDRYPGTKIVNLSRRTYPEGTLAAHVLGHLGPAADSGGQAFLPGAGGQAFLPAQRQTGMSALLVGRMGVERQYETLLRGQPGAAVQQFDRGGHALKSYCRQQPVAGRDLELTLDVRLQRTAEELLQNAKKRCQNYFPEKNSSDTFLSGGAIVVMDVSTGDILAAASMPKFDPNLFVQEDSAPVAALLADPSKPLFNRVCSMAIPPGSTFKVLTAVALLESGSVDPRQPFTCQGYLHQPDRRRCDIYIRQGIGHGDVTLADALAVSCNVYFFHFAELMGPRPLLEWAERFGFGHPTGVDLPSEAAGTLPSPETKKIDAQSLAIGQGSLTATPLQVLCMMAAVANGGRMVTPHVAGRVRACTHANSADSPDHRVRASTHPTTLEVIRDGLRRVVADPKGTAHGTVYIESIAVAGKTGTAETGGDRASHAWFAGYVPADEPKLAFVVVLEHAGDAAASAGPVAKRLVLRMEELGLL